MSPITPRESTGSLEVGPPPDEATRAAVVKLLPPVIDYRNQPGVLGTEEEVLHCSVPWDVYKPVIKTAQKS